MTICIGKAPGSMSVSFPACNDAPSPPALLAATFRTLKENFADREGIVVSESGGDGTDRVLARLQQHYGPPLRILTHEKNQGCGGALRSGFAAVAKEPVLYRDGEGQSDPAERCHFRLIRRAVLDALQLRWTSGTILRRTVVRKIELSGCGVEEVGVRRCPCLQGRSQFFRFRSLLTTLYQLVRLRIQLFILFVCILRPAVEECLSLP